MSPHERALLLQYGVTLAVIEALERAGCTTVEQVCGMSPEDLEQVPGIDRRTALIVRRCVGRLVASRVAAYRAGLGG